MNVLLKFHFPKLIRNILGCFSLLTAIITLLSIVPAPGQENEIFKCPESTYTFTGIPEQILCEQYPNFNCEIQIGAGTLYPKSSLLGNTVSGNVCVVGDFEVDEPFSFLNAVVKINPGVTIAVKPSPNGYASGSSLGIDNSKLFACNGLWKGITLGHLSSIGTTNNTKIEDAEKAIYASGLCALTIEQTTFNRNRIGLELDTPFPNIFVPGPLVWVFSNNRFTCDAPLNGTTNEITEAGVKLKNSYLGTFQSGLNRFSDLKYGIYAEGNFSHLGASHLYMQRIKKDGIYMAEGMLTLADSWFYFCQEKGVNIETAKLMDVRNTQFGLATTPTNTRRVGIYISKFALNAGVKINGISCGADMEGTTNNLTGVYLIGGNVGAGTKIRIGGNSVFSFRAKDSQGIYLDGVFPSNSTTEIWGNRFRVSNITGETGGRPSGVKTSGGEINNLSVKWNTFTSYVFNSFPPGTAGIPQWSYGVHLIGNFFGMGNEISVNGFNDEVQTLQFGLLSQVFQNTKYCSNGFNGQGFATAASFAGVCTGTDFTGNSFYFAGSQALLLYDNPMITLQSHKGNEWHNYFGVEPIYHSRCQGNPLFNKFIVHTQQSTCANESNPCFNPFHPRKIEPDLMDEFFGQQSGTPSEGCNDEFTGGGTDDLDRQIAQGTFTPPSGDPALGWVLQRYLYQKFKNNPDFTSEHTSFPAFMASNEYTTVGKFSAVHSAMENGFKAGPNVDEPSAQALSNISGLLQSMADTDQAIEQQGLTAALKSQKENLILQIHGLHWVYDSLCTIHKAHVAVNLQTAYSLNQAITTTQAYETNEKTVNQVHLLSFMQQGGEFTESQVAILQAIAQQDPKQGGPAVHTALGMLKECAKPGTLEQYLVAPPHVEYLESGQILEYRNNINTLRNASDVYVSPNPANSSFTIGNPSGISGMLVLFDASGRAWLQQKFSGQQPRIDLKAGTPSGVYFLRFELEDGSCVFKKLIVQSN